MAHGFLRLQARIVNNWEYVGMMPELKAKWHICKNRPAPSKV
jgi:hypothetical protein